MHMHVGVEETPNSINRTSSVSINFNLHVYALLVRLQPRGVRYRKELLFVILFIGALAQSLARGASRRHILDGVKSSLKRLQFEHIDLYQIHCFDPATPIEETVRALDQLVRHGDVRYVGVSNWAAWQVAKALGISDRLGLSRFESLQAYYSVARS